MTSFMESVLSWGQKLSALCIAMGAVLILLYCTSIQYYPNGIEIGDGLFFLWVALVFGFYLFVLITVLTFIGAFSYSSLIYAVNKARNSNFKCIPFKENWLGYILAVSVFILLLFLASSFELEVTDWVRLIACILFNGYFATWLYVGLDQQESQTADEDEVFEHESVFNGKNQKRKRIAIFFLFCLLFYVPLLSIEGFGSVLLQSTVSDLGIRKNNVTLYIDKKQAPFVSHILLEQGFNGDSTKFKDGSIRVSNVHILFHGIGKNTFFTVGEKNINFELPSDSVIVAQATANKNSGLNKLVMEKLGATLKNLDITYDQERKVFSFSVQYSEFQVGSSELPKELKAVLDVFLPQLFDFMAQQNGLITELEVIGFASEEWKSASSPLEAYQNNHELAVSRAVNVVGFMYDSPKVSYRTANLTKKITVKGISSNSSMKVPKRSFEIKLYTPVKED